MDKLIHLHFTHQTVKYLVSITFMFIQLLNSKYFIFQATQSVKKHPVYESRRLLWL